MMRGRLTPLVVAAIAVATTAGCTGPTRSASISQPSAVPSASLSPSATPTLASAPIPASGGAARAPSPIAAVQAINAALAAAPGGSVTKVDLDQGDIRPVWQCRVIQGALKRKVEINAVTGRVLFVTTERTTDVVTAVISAARAAKLALAALPDAQVTKIDLDEQEGRSFWKVDVVQGVAEREVEVDAGTGAIVAAGNG